MKEGERWRVGAQRKGERIWYGLRCLRAGTALVSAIRDNKLVVAQL